MLKPASLRAALTAAVPEFARNGDALSLYVQGGNIVSRHTASGNLGYEHRYTLQITVIDYSTSPDTVFFPLMHWLRTNQPDLFLNHARADSAIKYEVDIIDTGTVDISIEVPLVEALDVTINPEDGKYHMIYREETPIMGTEGLDGLATVPTGTNLLVTPYGEYLISDDGSVLSQAPTEAPPEEPTE